MTQPALGIFAACIDGTGRELWVTDGTAEGTHALADLQPGARGSDPTSGTVADGKLFFTADDGSHGRELWVSDGTAEGTRLLEIAAGEVGAVPENLIAVGDRLLFTADDGSHGRELWVSDGTAEGTRIVADINAGRFSSYPTLMEIHGRVFAVAGDAEHGREVWVSDGTEAGTHLFYETTPGPDTLFPRNFVEMGGDHVAFTVGTLPQKLVWTDVNGGPVTAFDIFDPGVPDARQFDYVGTADGLAVTVGHVVGASYPDDWSPIEQWRSDFWRTDGSVTGTDFLGSVTLPYGVDPAVNPAIHNGAFLFSVYKGTDKYDYTTRADLGVVDQETGRTILLVSGDDRPAFDSGASAMAGDRLLMPVWDSYAGINRLIATDGSAAGTKILIETDSLSISEPKIAGDKAFFLADGGTGDGTGRFALWATDGTVAGTHIFLAPEGWGYGHELLGALDGRMLAFIDGDTDRLYLSDGTADGTKLLAILEPGLDQYGARWVHPEILGVLPAEAPEDVARRGTVGRDDMAGGIVADRLHGLDGDDRLFGDAGNDRLNGGPGQDHVEGGAGDDRVYGGSGDDILLPGTGRDLIVGGSGNDTLIAQADGERDCFLFAPGCGRDTLAGYEAGVDRIALKGFDSGAPAPVLTGLDGAVYVDLGGGDSILVLDTPIGDLRITAE
jgi:ELWxxDGT repeat protein